MKQLGFALLAPDGTELLGQNVEGIPKENWPTIEAPVKLPKTPNTQISLLQCHSTKPLELGPLHKGQIQMKAPKCKEKGAYWFTPSVEGQAAGLCQESIQMGKRGNFKLKVTNHSTQRSISVASNVTVGTIGKAHLLEYGQFRAEVEKREEEHQQKLRDNEQLQKDGLHNGRVEKLLQSVPFGPEATEAEKTQVQEILTDYNDVFAVEERELGDCNLIEVEIDTGDSKPIAQPLRRTPITVRDKIDEEINAMLAMGIIRESWSDWASPIVAVIKPDGKIRICVDFRKVNEVTKSFQHPLPRMDDILEKIGISLGRSTSPYESRPCVSTFDLKVGYHQLRIRDEDAHKTAFRTHRGLYEYTRLPMGLKTAGSFFQKLMNKVFNGVLDDGIYCYLDDICIATSTFEEHLAKLITVLSRLREALLKLKPKKCVLLSENTRYLGHIVSREGLTPDPKKVDGIQSYPEPKTQTEVRRFLGMASYYRK
ncbi:MAG: RNA-directed DNA polymerase, partial [Gammaproteobacteria bacterium]|nr:RNA-directed DNA polymerase [Gammaproteobacteria bacterium]